MTLTDLERQDLLVNAEEGGHGPHPGEETRYVSTRLLGPLKREVFHQQVWGEQLNRLIVYCVLQMIVRLNFTATKQI